MSNTIRKLFSTFLLFTFLLTAHAHNAGGGYHRDDAGVGINLRANYNKIVLVVTTLTPVALSAAVGVSSQNFSVAEIESNDIVYVVTHFSEDGKTCHLTNATSNGAGSLRLKFVNLTAAACTPTAGQYRIFIFRQ